MNGFRRSKLLVRILGVGAVLCLLYAAAGFFLAPHLIEKRLVALVDQRLGQTLSIGKLKVNPFALSVEATGVRLAQGNGAPLLAAPRIFLDLNLLRSGIRRSWVLSATPTYCLQIQLQL